MEDLRRSAAAQFFMDDDVSEDTNQEVAVMINNATVSADPTVKIEILMKVQKIVLNENTDLLNTYLADILGFQNDRNSEVRKWVVGFVEDAIKKDIEVLPHFIMNLQSMLQDKAPLVQKRLVQCMTHVYRSGLMWMCKAPTVTDQMQRVWSVVTNMKAHIIDMVDCENDGLRTQIVKFLEMLVLLQTYPEPESVTRSNEFSLEDIPLTLKVARRRKLEEEAMTVFDLMIKFHGSQHISSANLMACMGSLVTIAKARPAFMGKVIVALETLHMNLPPTLSSSQVNSVRKHLRLQLLNLLKNPAAVDYHLNITTLLTDLGASSHEISKALPKGEDMKKRLRKGPQTEVPSKKIRLEEPPPEPQSESAVDITEAFIVERLTPELAAQIVLSAINKVPDVMPPLFSSSYTPIAAAGTQIQVKHVARLLATQLTAAGLGPGASIAKTFPAPLRTGEEEDEDEPAVAAVTTSVLDDPEDDIKGTTNKNIKLEVGKSLNQEMRDNLQTQAVLRILRSQESAITGGVSSVRGKIIASFAASYGPHVRQTIMNYILSDLKGQLNLVLSWIYEEYSYMQGFSKRAPTQTDDNKYYDSQYDHLICTIINCVINNKEIKDRETILTRICLEMPVLTDQATELLRNFSSVEVLGLDIISKIVLMRPPKQMLFLNVLLDNTSHQTPEIRETSISHIVDLYTKDELQTIIEDYAVYFLGFLKLPSPPPELFGQAKGRPHVEDHWTDDCTKACLYLYLSLLPINQQLIHELARVYIQTVADVKRIILRVVEHPVKAMGMDSPQLLKLVEDCPKGSETLVTRLIHILTDKSAPSIELVNRVRDLYQTRVSDVRFLIPVLNGLTKSEIIAALPKLIKLNPIVVKEVFNRLLCAQNESSAYTSPITPSELLIALHTIDPAKCELKTVIKATSLCFSDKQAYTQEVLAVVMQHLMEVTPLPTLLMRTVIQALSLYPRLIGFVMNILQRLILKQVWRQKKVWEGFIKCCQRAQPHSFQVLLQLPAPQLADVFEEAPDLKKPLLDHIMEFTENQRAHIPQTIMDILMGPAAVNNNLTIKEEPLSPQPELSMDIKDELPDVLASKTLPQPAPPGLD